MYKVECISLNVCYRANSTVPYTYYVRLDGGGGSNSSKYNTSNMCLVPNYRGLLNYRTNSASTRSEICSQLNLMDHAILIVEFTCLLFSEHKVRATNSCIEFQFKETVSGARQLTSSK